MPFLSRPRIRQLALALGMLTALPVTATPRTIAYLGIGSANIEQACIAELLASLASAGWKVGEQLTLEQYHAESDQTRLAGLAARAVASRPDLLLTTEVAPTAAVLAATRDIPIVVIGAANLRASGAVDATGKPLANATGVTLALSGQHIIKPFEILLQAFPEARKLGIVENHGNPMHRNEVRQVASMARDAGIDLVRVHFSGADTIPETWEALAREGVEAVLVRADSPAYLAEHARQARRLALPAISHHMQFAQSGGLLTYGVVGRIPMCPRAARYIDKILRGQPVAELPVEELYEAGLTIHLGTAEAIGAKLPPALIQRADRLLR